MSDRSAAAGAMPAAALKRFSDDLKTNQTGSRFLEENLKRVDQFISKPSTVDLDLDPRVEDQLGQDIETTEADVKTRSPEEKAAYRKEYWQSRGVNEYAFDELGKKSTMIDLQKFPEMSTALGIRSRFGEGDGSFMDRWLTTPTSDPSVSAVPLNGDVIPPFTGFKRHVNTFKHGPLKQTDAYRTIKPYAVRRQERLEKERKERDKNAGVASQFEPTGRYMHEGLASPEVAKSNDANATDDVELLPKDQAFLTLPPLSEAERDTYFGAKARVAFFDFYNQLSRMKNITSYGSATELLTGLDSDDEEPEEYTEREQTPSLPPLKNNRKPAKIAGEEEGEGGGGGERDGDDSETEIQGSGEEGILDDGISTTTPINEQVRGTDLAHPPEDAGNFRPSSARSRFIAQCVEHDIGPMPALIIRKGVSGELNLRSQNIGDSVAIKLATSLNVMPHMQHFNISDNGLTDPGLSSIIRALHGCKYLLSLDIGRNKIDIEAAHALGDYLQSPDCHLRHLGLQNADIDDLEASKFVEAIAVKNTIQYLDMSRNLLGTQENKASMDPRHPTGGGAIAALLRSATCPLRTLNLSWNSMRTSGIPVAQALTVNQTVTHLDLSYNSLGNEGAEVLGDALHYNSALVTLDLTQTKVQARGCFVLVQGTHSCHTLRRLILSENPIGDIGLRSVMSLQMQFTIEELQVEIRGCSFKMQDASATFDPKHVSGVYSLNLSKPYDRAVCIGLSREVASHDDVCFTEYKHNGLPMKFEVRKRNKTPRLEPVKDEDEGKAPEPGEGDREGKTVEQEEVESKEEVAVAENKVGEGPEGEASIGEEGGVESKEEVSESAKPAAAATAAAVDILSISGDIDHAEVMFNKYDSDSSGGIDRQELVLVLKELGLSDTLDVVEELMEQYDADGGGIIELAEFREFLLTVQLSAAKNQTFDNEERYLIDDLHSGDLHAQEYAILDEGVVECTVSTGQAIPEYIQAMSADKLESLLSTAQASSDSSALLQAAVSTTKLKAAEAKRVYRALLKDSGDMVQSLKMVIPHCFSSADARALIAYARPTSVSEMCKLKSSLGRMYYVCIGVPNGYYHLQLEDEQDRLCLDKLIDAGAAAKDMRVRTDQCDNSQLGDWRGFRNVLFNNQPAVIDDDFLVTIPEKGSLSFDFVILHDYSFAKMDSALSNRRLHKILTNLRMLEDLKYHLADLRHDNIFDNKVTKLNDDGRISSKGVGIRFWEVTKDVCPEFTAKQDEMFANLPHRNGGREVRGEESLKEVSPLEEDYLNMADQSRPSTDSHNTHHSHGHMEEDEKISDNVLGLYQSHLSGLFRSTANEFNPQMVSYRTYEALIEALASRYITCAQLGYLVKLFPHNSITLDPDSFIASLDGHTMAKREAEEGGASLRGELGEGVDRVMAEDIMDETTSSDVQDVQDMIRNAVKEGADAGSEGGAFDVEEIEKEAAEKRAKEEEDRMKELEKENDASSYAAETAQIPLEPEEEPFCGFSTVRVNLVVKLFSQVVDKVNMDSVLKFMKPAEIAMVIFRLGYLNVFNTLKPEGYWRLNMSRRDEKQFVRALILLSFAEPGQNWQNQSFEEAGKHEDTNWTLPLSWFDESKLPKAGVVKLKYVSSDPLHVPEEGEEDFKPDFAKRSILTCISQSQPYAADAKLVKKATAKNAENMITEEFGVQLSLLPPPDESKK